MVALKTLIVIYRALKEVEPKKSYHVLNLGHFKDDSSPNAWDYSAWVRSYALFLERLECFRVLKYDVETEPPFCQIILMEEILMCAKSKFMDPDRILFHANHFSSLLQSSLLTLLTLILPAGYLGSSFWGMVLILASTNLVTARIAAGCLILSLFIVLFIAKNWTLRGLCIRFIIFIAVVWVLQELTKVLDCSHTNKERELGLDHREAC
ncbi:unnamed protein product [Fraxinus pennsylvanica]|uniref:AP180 N-terminal homology (ANTH) domain-containing protein n=1 Tax=Fraxinus pennsylvanica TaxID=56036 RepID=A0AAD1YMJ4_9LAMI|nr:unnamed protein product [Fraxinus pennsylvanica]